MTGTPKGGLDEITQVQFFHIDEPLSSTEEGKSEGGAIRGDQPQESIEECPSQRNMVPAIAAVALIVWGE